MYRLRILTATAAVCLLAGHVYAQTAVSFPAVERRGTIVAVSGIAAPAGQLPAGFAAQADAIMKALADRLAASGSSLSQVVSTTVYLANAADFPALNEAWKRTWPTAPPTRTTIVAALSRPGALLEVSAIALTTGTERVLVRPAGWPVPASPYSWAIRSGDTLFVSGLIPRRGADNAQITGDMRVQTQGVLDNARTILEAAGMTMADVVSARLYITDAAQFQAMNEVYRTYFPQAPPARATVRAALTHPDYLVEITLTAVKGGDRTVLTTPAADGTPGRPNPNLSSAVRVGPSLYLSGMLGVVPGNASDLAAQTAETLAR
ncbi:MAG: RidA family protein, partial [Vicinamibacterales bacterium]|nr:RidA family protein [Vicinamibacterales bacterium]